MIILTAINNVVGYVYNVFTTIIDKIIPTEYMLCSLQLVPGESGKLLLRQPLIYRIKVRFIPTLHHLSKSINCGYVWIGFNVILTSYTLYKGLKYLHDRRMRIIMKTLSYNIDERSFNQILAITNKSTKFDPIETFISSTWLLSNKFKISIINKVNIYNIIKLRQIKEKEKEKDIVIEEKDSKDSKDIEYKADIVNKWASVSDKIRMTHHQNHAIKRIKSNKSIVSEVATEESFHHIDESDDEKDKTKKEVGGILGWFGKAKED
jgi:hypothetical protein